jgi:TM2 domain-containing membrane protein YozV
VTEFSITEQQMMTKGLSPEQAMLFNSQFSSTKKDRDTVLILSVILGCWGVDRFYVGDMGMGLLKLFTFGGCGILWLIDIFMIRDRADEYNRNKAGEVLAGIRMMAG